MLLKIVKCITVNTGNIISSKELKTKAMQSPTEEVFDSISTTFHNWLKSNEELVNKEEILCKGPHSMPVDKTDRINLKVSAKIFLEEYNCENLTASISEVMNMLEVVAIDSLILAVPATTSQDRISIEKLKPLWRVLESFVQAGKIVMIGISDLDARELAELYEWSEVKPSVNQVNLESCCVMPPELTALAKDNDIQLLTHNDPKVILPQESLMKILAPGVETPNEWNSQWIVRYSVVVKCRGIIQNKGYLLSVSRKS